MPNIAYNISLKAYIGGLDLDRLKVEKEPAKCEGNEVNVIIDSLGGSLVIRWCILKCRSLYLLETTLY